MSGLDAVITAVLLLLLIAIAVSGVSYFLDWERRTRLARIYRRIAKNYGLWEMALGEAILPVLQELVETFIEAMKQGDLLDEAVRREDDLACIFLTKPEYERLIHLLAHGPIWEAEVLAPDDWLSLFDYDLVVSVEGWLLPTRKGREYVDRYHGRYEQWHAVRNTTEPASSHQEDVHPGQGEHTEENLEELRKLIYGEGRYSFFGRGLHTYPHRSADHDVTYSGCVELERRGLVCRQFDGQDHVLFVPVEKKP